MIGGYNHETCPVWHQHCYAEARPLPAQQAGRPRRPAPCPAQPSRCNGISAACIASSYVATATPARYISRLCTQFSHKLPVSFDEHQGRIEFAFGLSHLYADTTGLHITALSNNLQDLEKLKHLIATHFERFAWQAELSLDWQ
ncbi:MAG: DUF2218 domain-containing protein [Pseudomonas sp.]|uniref:DUF2218 domain-containing protein n=1 Tax=Pseudomonas sp. TaxID=306 RepID=UPI00299F204A|nr:DUF2218 domain-containing protein [Pseudomonas sp.]MDX1724974.1 DUF2218 domain-containing protein [Pseudomonas sp.]